MDHIHGIDVSWIHNTHHKDHQRPSKSTANGESTAPRPPTKSPSVAATAIQNGDTPVKKEAPATPPTTDSPNRPGFGRIASNEKLAVSDQPQPSPSGRRNSWFSGLSAKFSSLSTPEKVAGQRRDSNPGARTPPSSDEQHALKPMVVPRGVAVLAHAQTPQGNEPYIPAPPRTPQPNFLQSALRRLSSSSGQLSTPTKPPQYGICERRVMNVDKRRERCKVPELNQAKLRRVSFCVDVEIAGGPRYMDDLGQEEQKDKQKKKKLGEKGEGDALKHPNAVRDQKEKDGVVRASGEKLPKEPEKEGQEPVKDEKAETEEKAEKDAKKKEKKKKSEEERKARKEKKRKLAEANGTIPVEFSIDGSEESTVDTPTTIPGTPRTQATPTTDPVRIYRRCCQLRETPILKRITEQLSAPSNQIEDKPGFVRKLDLTGFWLQLPDMVTLGDYLAVVPVKELIMENAGLTDEAVRLLLAGLLAAKYTDPAFRRKHRTDKIPQQDQQGGVVERVVFKNNPKIGREGWTHIALFIHMCRSLKSLDLSMIPFPQPQATTPPANGTAAPKSGATESKTPEDMSEILSKALSERFAGPELDLLNMAETGLSTDQLGRLIDAVNISGLGRLGLAGNGLTAEGVAHVVRFLKNGKCTGLDLGGIDLKDHLGAIADSLTEGHPLWALSLANCGLTPDSLKALLPALSQLQNFRFIDLSHNKDLFGTEHSALSLLRRYLPKMKSLKRIHLADVSMTFDDAVAVAEIIPECPGLAHVRLLENPKLSVLADAKGEAQQEEACALYASLMTAARVSHSIVSIEVDVPSPESSEVVIALAKQLVAYCLRNMERGPVAEIAGATAASMEAQNGEKEVVVPDVLLHLVGHVEGFHENHDDDDPAPDEDYVIGGTGVVKALGICLRNKFADTRRPSTDLLNQDSDTGTNTPSGSTGVKAKDMSKNLLGSARKIRARLQPALVKEAKTGDRNAYQRLVFLDQTLEGMIKRFEDEYPETRLLNTSVPASLPTGTSLSPTDSIQVDSQFSDTEHALVDDHVGASDDEEGLTIRPLSRHSSDVSLASRALSQEEGRMHRFGQAFRRDILKDPSQASTAAVADDESSSSSANQTNTPSSDSQPSFSLGQGPWAPHLEMLRATIEGLEGEEIRKLIVEGGQEAVLKELSAEEGSLLRQRIIDADPEGWERFRVSQEVAARNVRESKGGK